MVEKLNKHDRYVAELCDMVKDDYDLILKNIPIYSRRNRLVGEIDVLGIKDGHYDVYEVKCSHRIVKARKQIKKIRKSSLNSKIRNTFFFCGISGALIAI